MDTTDPTILVAPGPYKECLTSVEVAEAMCGGVRELLPGAKIMIRPLCDGGSGVASVLAEATGGRLEEVTVKGPTGEAVTAALGFLGDRETCVVESASAAGLSLVPKDKRNPLLTSTYGVGQLIDLALKRGATKIIVGCGDSGTNDCGIGCAAALGVRFYVDDSAEPLAFPRGSDLLNIVRIDATAAQRRLATVEVTVACNLTSVLCGPDATSAIYGPQKGATPEQVMRLQAGVDRFVGLMYQTRGLDLSFVPGAGGSGGLAASLYTFFGGRLMYSLDVVDRHVKLDQYLSRADLVLTGEGRIDDRTATGKVACGVALRAKKYGVPVVAIVGSIAQDHEDIFYNGIDAVESISEGPMSLDECIGRAPVLIQAATMRVMRFVFRISPSAIRERR